MTKAAEVVMDYMNRRDAEPGDIPAVMMTHGAPVKIMFMQVCMDFMWRLGNQWARGDIDENSPLYEYGRTAFKFSNPDVL